MPFEPKLIESEPAPLNEAGEIRLSPEMQELAVRMRREADHLTDRLLGPDSEFGVESSAGNRLADALRTSSRPGVGARRKRRIVFVFASLSAILATGLFLFGILHVNGILLQTPTRPSRFDRDSAATHPSGFRAGIVQHELAAHQSKESKPAARDSQDSRVPERDGHGSADPLLLEVTGPELEGLLDLLEGDASQSQHLSI